MFFQVPHSIPDECLLSAPAGEQHARQCRKEAFKRVRLLYALIRMSVFFTTFVSGEHCKSLTDSWNTTISRQEGHNMLALF